MSEPSKLKPSRFGNDEARKADVRALAEKLYAAQFSADANHHERAKLAVEAAEAFVATWEARK